jgi:hypothetical protein
MVNGTWVLLLTLKNATVQQLETANQLPHWMLCIMLSDFSFRSRCADSIATRRVWLYVIDAPSEMGFRRCRHGSCDHICAVAFRTSKRTRRVRLRRAKWSKSSGHPFASGVAPAAGRINYFFIYEAIIYINKKT